MFARRVAHLTRGIDVADPDDNSASPATSAARTDSPGMGPHAAVRSYAGTSGVPGSLVGEFHSRPRPGHRDRPWRRQQRTVMPESLVRAHLDLEARG